MSTNPATSTIPTSKGTSSNPGQNPLATVNDVYTIINNINAQKLATQRE